MSGPASAARQLFDQLVHGGAEAILSALRAPDPEHDILDFKRVATSRFGAGSLVDGDRSNLGKCISGFANSGGGVVVWGLDDPPANTEWAPGCPDAAAFIQAARQQATRLAEPPQAGLEFVEVPGPNGDPPAVLMLVPPRSTAPVQAKNKKSRVFFFRAGESFVPATPELVGAMFGKTGSAVLHLRMHPQGGNVSDEVFRQGKMTLGIELLVENTGSDIGFHAYINGRTDLGPYVKAKGTRGSGSHEYGSATGFTLQASAAVPIPPGAVQPLGRLDLVIRPSMPNSKANPLRFATGGLSTVQLTTSIALAPGWGGAVKTWWKPGASHSELAHAILLDAPWLVPPT